MTRGNQRELARQKGLKKQAEEGKGQRKDGKTFASAKESDAEIMRKKQEAAMAKKAAAAGGSNPCSPRGCVEPSRGRAASVRAEACFDALAFDAVPSVRPAAREKCPHSTPTACSTQPNVPK
eukprot:CAMPEP_0174827194 /NCGR_PEP_ID=MMETSP1114-20130205/544_1 /TAXON_ID=312471 /ORGANISM="Neobodo designis, Strain CCAP 1951/1" /LENGTH=121 /DNA_ID=CAMNT_0016060801 /DNA_START=63 /DNA_END=429 /DNA_ORIENTATION=-